MKKHVIETIPGDKSISHRAIIIGSLATNASTFHNFLCAEDCLNTVAIFQKCGIPIEIDIPNQVVTIQGQGLKGLLAPTKPLDCGNSGTGIRLITGVLAAQPFNSIISGDATIEKRPMKRIIDPLSEMGAKISGNQIQGKKDIFPPLTITGQSPLQNISYTLPVASAQVKSAVLLASLFSKKTTTVIEPEPCRNHTEIMLKGYGADITVKEGNITCSGKNSLSNPQSSPHIIPADFSSAAFFIVLGLIQPNTTITLTKIGLNPTRSALLDCLLKMGANITISNKGGSQFEPYGDITVSTSQLTNIDVPEDIMPFIIDEIPILAIAALHATGICRIRNAKELRVKESDRISAIVKMVQAMGGKVKEYEDGLDIEGPCQAQNCSIETFHDHRIAMSALIEATASNITIIPDNIECINTSFPNFFEILQQLS